MRIFVNGDESHVDDGATVGSLVDSLERGRSGIAIARNGELVPRSQWNDRHVDNGDRFDVLIAAQGG